MEGGRRRDRKNRIKKNIALGELMKSDEDQQASHTRDAQKLFAESTVLPQLLIYI